MTERTKHMRKTFETFIRRPFWSVAIVVVLMTAGAWSLYKMPVDYFPGINYPLVNVVTEYSGVSPRDMEILVTRPIEGALQSIRGVQRTSSVTTMGHSEITVEFGNGFTVMDARQLTSAALSAIAGQLPPGAVPVIDNLGSRMQQVIGFTFTNPRVPPGELRNIIRFRIRPALLASKNISRIEVLGGERPAFLVEPDPEKLRLLHLSLRDIAKVLKDNNIIVSGRYLEKNYYDIPIRGDGRYRKLSDLENLKVAEQAHGLPVFLKEVATIRRGGLPEHYLIRSDTLPAVALLVQKTEGAGSIAVAESVEKSLTALKSLLPPGTRIHKFYDQSEILRTSMRGVRRELFAGAVLAMLTLLLFLRRRGPTLVVAITIPLALMFAAIGMAAIGYSLNMITLAALTLSLGMVVDDSIIVLEIIEKFLEKGKSLMESIQKGVSEIFAADLNGTLTTIIVFLPLLFISGYMKALVIPFGLTIALTLTGSFLISITVIPALVHRTGGLKGKKVREPLFLHRFRQLNDRVFRFSQTHHTFVIITLTLLFLVTGGVLPRTNKADLLPPVDEGALLFEYTMRPGVSLKESAQVAGELVQVVRKNRNVESIYLRIGSPSGTYYVEGVNRGELYIKLVDKKKRTETVSRLIAGFKKELASFEGVAILYHQPTQENIDESFSGLPAFFGVTITGPNLDTLTRLAAFVEKTLKKTGNFSDIINHSKYLVPQISVTPNRVAMARYGISGADLFRELSLAFRGEIVARFVKEEIPVAVFLRLPPADRNNLKKLEHLAIRTQTGKYIPLNRVARIKIVQALPSISHLNGQRELTVVADPEGNLFGAVTKLRNALKTRFLPDGYNLQIRGQYQTLMETFQSFLFVILIAVLLIYLILFLQFNSCWQPFVILLKIPLDFIGVFIALLITRQQLNISVALGLLTLTGVSVNNAILLMDKVNRLRKEEGYSLQEALQEAVHLRTRPILMTGITTITALLPAAAGLGSAIHQPFAITVIGGMITGIIFSLNVIPMFYSIFARRFEKKAIHA